MTIFIDEKTISKMAIVFFPHLTHACAVECIKEILNKYKL